MSARASSLLALRLSRGVAQLLAADSTGLERAFYLCEAERAEHALRYLSGCLLSPQPTL